MFNSLPKEILQFQVPFIKVQKKDVNQKIFLCAEDSLRRLVEISEFHGQNCAGNLKMKNIHQRVHVLSTKFQCEEEECKHIFLWSSSPYLPNNDYLINNRVNHSLCCLPTTLDLSMEQELEKFQNRTDNSYSRGSDIIWRSWKHQHYDWCTSLLA